MFQSVLHVAILMAGQLAYEADSPTDTLESPRFFDSSEQPAASLQAPARIAEPETSLSSRSEGAAPLAVVGFEITQSPETLLRGVLAGVGERGVDGQTVELAEVLSAVVGSNQRLRATQAYWRLARQAAAYRFCVEEANYLDDLATPQPDFQRAILASAQASARADEARSRLDTLRSQQALATAGARTDAGRLPLPADLPFVGAYETRFEALKAQGRAPAPLARIHDTLPMQRQLLQQQAEAVFAADEALHKLSQGYQQGQVPLSGVLDGLTQLKNQRLAFLDAVLEYNEAIAEYAMMVASPDLPVQRIIGMLIEVPDNQSSVLSARRSADSVRPVSNEEPIPAQPTPFNDER
jgi:hypothetical protein